jgi:hypothetical protein
MGKRSEDALPALPGSVTAGWYAPHEWPGLLAYRLGRKNRVSPLAAGRRTVCYDYNFINLHFSIFFDHLRGRSTEGTRLDCVWSSMVMAITQRKNHDKVFF